MIKREKVVEGLRHCTSHNDGRDKFGGVGKCGGCPYYGHDCTDRMKTDALALLQEQEAVKPRVSTVEQRCGNCNKVIEMDGWKACPWCGKMIDWERWWKKNGTRNQDT